jgi:hypothetical protein
MFDRLRRLFRNIRALFERRHPPVTPSMGAPSTPAPTAYPIEVRKVSDRALLAGALDIVRPQAPSAAGEPLAQVDAIEAAKAAVGTAVEAVDAAVEAVKIAAKPRREERDKMRRRLERNRLRYDIFVEPKGPALEKQTRAPAPPRPKLQIVPPPEPTPSLDYPELLIAEETKRGDEVLIKEQEIYGEFTFRDTILDQLERYFVYLKRMKKHDADSYVFYKKVGITLLPLASTFMTDVQFRGKHDPEDKSPRKYPPTLPSWFKQVRPAFGCFAFGTNSYLEKTEDEESKERPGRRKWHPRFMYFCKYASPPPELQPMSGGDIYKLTIWFDTHDPKMAKRMGGGHPYEFGVFVSRDGDDLALLKSLKTETMQLYAKRNRRGGKRGLKRSLDVRSIPIRAWSIPKDFVRWAKIHNETPDQFFIGLFCDTMRRWEQAGFSMIKVHVQKDDMTAVFGVDVHRLGYFFQDRDIELTETGVKKRIFHIVRPHERMTKEGKKTVPFHFRGLREFDWAGYHVRITVPRPDLSIRDFDVGSHDEYWMDPKDKSDWVLMPELAERLVALEEKYER